MKDNLFDLEKLEELLLSKSYSELTAEELLLVSEHVNSESEYNDLRDTLSNVKNVFRQERLSLQPKIEMKEALLSRFEQIHGSSGPGQVSPSVGKFHIPVFYKFAGVAAMLLIGIFIVYNEFSRPKEKDVIAMNKDKSENNELRPPIMDESHHHSITDSFVKGSDDKLSEADNSLKKGGDVSGGTLIDGDGSLVAENKKLEDQPAKEEITVDMSMAFDEESPTFSTGTVTNMTYSWGDSKLRVDDKPLNKKAEKEQNLDYKETVTTTKNIQAPQRGKDKSDSNRESAKRDIRRKLIYSDL